VGLGGASWGSLVGALWPVRMPGGSSGCPTALRAFCRGLWGPYRVKEGLGGASVGLGGAFRGPRGS